MWHAMSPPPNSLPSYGRPGAPAGDRDGPSVFASSAPNPDGSSNVYVHHMSHGSPHPPQAPPPPPQPQMQMPQMQMPQMQMPQMMPIPMPMPMPMPYPMPTPPPPPPPPMYNPYPMPPPMYGQFGMQQQQRQPTVVVIGKDPSGKEKPKPKDDDGRKTKKEWEAEAAAAKKKKEEEAAAKKKKDEEAAAAKKKKEDEAAAAKKKKEEEAAAKLPRRFSKFSIVSVIIFVLALVFGIACVCKTYEAYDERVLSSVSIDHEDYVVDRTVAIGTGAASMLCFTISTLCGFYAGARHASRNGGKAHGCQAGFVIASWIVFTLTFVNALVILVLAFDEDNIIYPEVVWSALIGSIISWMLMFGYSEMARRG